MVTHKHYKPSQKAAKETKIGHCTLLNVLFWNGSKGRCILNEMSSPDISMSWLAFLIVRKFYKTVT